MPSAMPATASSRPWTSVPERFLPRNPKRMAAKPKTTAGTISQKATTPATNPRTPHISAITGRRPVPTDRLVSTALMAASLIMLVNREVWHWSRPLAMSDQAPMPSPFGRSSKAESLMASGDPSPRGQRVVYAAAQGSGSLRQPPAASAATRDTRVPAHSVRPGARRPRRSASYRAPGPARARAGQASAALTA